MLSAIFVTDQKGKVIVSRNYRGDLPISVSEKFQKLIADGDSETVPPVVDLDDGTHFVNVAHSNLFFLAATQRNSNVALIIQFLYSVIAVMEKYFGSLEQESIRDNFVIVYELLDEMMDFGYPQITESAILQQYIMNESHKLVHEVRPPDSVTNIVGWRLPNIQHRRNECFLDVIEKLSILVSSNGTVVHSEILGSLVMKCYLSGMPELKLGLNDKLLFESENRESKGRTVEMEDIRFHQCVRLSKFEHDRTISFIPPDGEFELMSYRLNTQVRPLFLVEARTQRHSRSRIEYSVKVRSQYKRKTTANFIEIEIPVPADADTPSFKTTIGQCTHVPEKNIVVWKIKQFPGRKEYVMRAQLGLPSIQSEDAVEENAPINIKFEVPYFTVSGIQVRYLKIIEKSGYQALPWVRYIAQNGDYQIRMSH